jgi:hypothetical protein
MPVQTDESGLDALGFAGSGHGARRLKSAECKRLSEVGRFPHEATCLTFAPDAFRRKEPGTLATARAWKPSSPQAPAPLRRGRWACPSRGRRVRSGGMSTYDGGCHCGRVRFRASIDLARVSECNCSICTKKGYLHAIIARDAFELIAGEDDLTTYRFNTGVAKHRFCKHCGVQSFYVPRSDPDKIDVNVRCLEGVDLRSLNVIAFDGRRWEESMARGDPR